MTFFQGTKGRKRQVGWFPASYVKLMGGSDKSAAAPGGDAAPGVSPAPEAAAASTEEPQRPKFKVINYRTFLSILVIARSLAKCGEKILARYSLINMRQLQTLFNKTKT